MHFLNKPLYRIAIILVLLWLSTALAPATGQAQSTLPHVSGLITSDTQWTAAGGPYVLDGDVEVAAGVTLTIEPGAVVDGGRAYAVRVLGTLRAVGQPANPVLLRDVDVGGGDSSPDTPYQIEIQHAQVRGGRIHPAGMASYGSLILRDSIVTETRPKHSWPDNNSIYLWYPVAGSYIERNIFYRSYGVNAGVSDADVYVRNNVFAEWKSDSAVELWARYKDAQFLLEHNSFLSTDRVAVKSQYGTDVMATHNYWSSTDLDVIGQMVRDRTTDPDLEGIVVYEPFLMEPHADTPSWIAIGEPGYSFRTSSGQGDSFQHDLTVVSSRAWTLTAPSWLGTTQSSGRDRSRIGLYVKGDDLAVGVRTGEITVTTDDGVAASIPVQVEVTDRPTATDIAGEIKDIAIWSAAGSPYELTADVTVAPGARLIIEPGVVVDGQGQHAIQVFGSLRAVGAPSQPVRLVSVGVEGGENSPYDVPYQLEIQHAEVKGGRLRSSNYGSLHLRDSHVEDLQDILYIWYPVEDVYIERNIFMDSFGISAGISDGVNLYVRNNVFQRQQESYGNYYAVHIWASYGASRPVVEYNSFLSTDRVAVNHRPDWQCPMWSAQNNYWGTVDAGHIARMIYDWSDYACGQTVGYEPFLTGPHPDTPWMPDMPAADPGAAINWVSGHLTATTTWTAAGSPYVLNGDVAVGRGSTLTIEPGAEVRGNGLALRIYGRLAAVGTQDDPVLLRDVDIGGGDSSPDTPYQIEIQHAQVRGGRIHPAGMASYGSLILRDSIIANTKPKHSWPDNNSIQLWYPVAGSYIERNIFYRSYGVNAGVSDADAYVRNNVFAEWKSDSAVELWARYEDAQFLLEHNSFLNTDRVAVKSQYGTDVMAAHNYWGTADAGLIAQMVKDKTNDPELEGTVIYEPFLTGPHADTPPLPSSETLEEPIVPPNPIVPDDPNPDPTPDPDPDPASKIYLPAIERP